MMTNLIDRSVGTPFQQSTNDAPDAPNERKGAAAKNSHFIVRSVT